MQRNSVNFDFSDRYFRVSSLPLLSLLHCSRSPTIRNAYLNRMQSFRVSKLSYCDWKCDALLTCFCGVRHGGTFNQMLSKMWAAWFVINRFLLLLPQQHENKQPTATQNSRFSINARIRVDCDLRGPTTSPALINAYLQVRMLFNVKGILQPACSSLVRLQRMSTRMTSSWCQIFYHVMFRKQRMDHANPEPWSMTNEQ